MTRSLPGQEPSDTDLNPREARGMLIRQKNAAAVDALVGVDRMARDQKIIQRVAISIVIGLLHNRSKNPSKIQVANWNIPRLVHIFTGILSTPDVKNTARQKWIERGPAADLSDLTSRVHMMATQQGVDVA